MSRQDLRAIRLLGLELARYSLVVTLAEERLAAYWPMLRWLVVGGLFELIGTPLLYVFHGVWLVPLLAASLLVAELTALPRFFVNDRWVFGHTRPSWRRLWQYHVACAGGFATWFSVTNLLPLLGVHYVVASLCGTACSVGLAILSNFGWVWRRSGQEPETAAEARVGGSIR